MKFLLVDDHPLMRSALRQVVEGLGADVTVVEAAGSGDARAALAAQRDFDAVLLDLRLGTPEGSQEGLAVLRDIRSQYPRTPVMVITGSDDGRDLIRAVDGGAMAYVHKRSPGEEVLRALEVVMAGGIYLPDDMMALLTATRAAVQSAPIEAPGVPVGQGGFGLPQPSPQALARLGLTPRQTDVLMLLLHGKPNKLIARELNLSVETIKDHVAAVLRSLNVTSRTQAVLAVTQLGQMGQMGTLGQMGGQLPPRRGLQ